MAADLHNRTRGYAEIASRHAALLAQVSAILSSSLDSASMVDQIVRLVTVDFVHTCGVDLVMHDRSLDKLAIADRDPAKEAMLRDIRRRYPADPTRCHPFIELALGSRPGSRVWSKEVLGAQLAQNEEHLALLRQASPDATVLAPMKVGDRLIGIMKFGRYGQSFLPEEASLCEELAQRVASSVDNARAYRAERSARIEAERIAQALTLLQEITSDLSRALTPVQVAEVVARKGVAAMHASLALVCVPSADGDWLEVVGHEASPTRLVKLFRRVRLDEPSPVNTAYRRGLIEAFETEIEYRERYPKLYAAASPISGTHASLCAPLLLEGRSIGVLALSFREDRRFSAEDHAFALTLARQCAQALDRARLFEAEHRLNERLRLLALAGDMLSSSLDYEITLQNIVGLAIPALADVCFLDIMEEDEVRRIGRASEAHAEIAGLAEKRWSRETSTGASISALCVGQPRYFPDVDDESLRQTSGDLDGLALLRELELCSVITVPLYARGEALGALTLGFSASRRRHTLVDLDLAEELAGRAATALENARLHRASREATRLAEHANRAKDEFLGVVSHELRTPLNAILGWSQLLRGDRRTSALLDKGLSVIDRNARAQAKLIEDILDVSRIISGKLRIELHSLDLDTVIRSSVEVLRPAADARNVELLICAAPGALVSGDPDRLQQVVGNLLANAIKFTPEGGVVQVRLERRDRHASIVICDSGKGIDPAFLPYVFERFRQADSSTTRRHGGLGLGLAIVRHLVELHGGMVSAESEGQDRGSTFTVKLPLRADSPAQPEPTPRSCLESDPDELFIQRLDGLKVLVVDDEPDAQEMISTMLLVTGAEVAVASSANEAIARLETFAADVLVSDVGMPGEDGYTLIRRIRASSAPYARIPAVALTAYASTEDARRAALAGFHAHLAKPAEPAVLTTLVANLGRRSPPSG